MKILVIQRVGLSNDRVTQHGSYCVDSKGFIMDDNNNPMKPKMNNKLYWRITKTDNSNPIETVSNETDNTNSIETVENVKGNKMLKVETVVLVNDKRADQMEDREIINLIHQEEEYIEKIMYLHVKSKAVRGIVEKHRSNVNKLLTILDCNIKED